MTQKGLAQRTDWTDSLPIYLHNDLDVLIIVFMNGNTDPDKQKRHKFQQSYHS